MIGRLTINFLFPVIELFSRNKWNPSLYVFFIFHVVSLRAEQAWMIMGFFFFLPDVSHINKIIKADLIYIKALIPLQYNKYLRIALPTIINQTTKMLIKIAFKNQVHVTQLKDTDNFEDLRDFISHAFKKAPKNYKLTYYDDDQDAISLMNDIDLSNLREYGAKKIKIFLEEDPESYQELELQNQNQSFMEIQKHVGSSYEVQEIIERRSNPIIKIEGDARSGREEIDLKEFPDLEIQWEKPQSQIKMQPIQQKKKQSLIQIEQKQLIIPLQQLEEEEAQQIIIKKSQEFQKFVHEGITCDLCQKTPIIGARYKCIKCEDFDLCEQCEKTTNHMHAFIKINSAEQEPEKIYSRYSGEEEMFHEKCLNGLGVWVESLNLQEKIENTKKNLVEAPKAALSGLKNFSISLLKKFSVEENKEFYVDIEQKKQVKQQEDKKIKPKIRYVQKNEQIINNASYLSSILGKQFGACYKFSQRFPGIKEEELLIKYFDNHELL